MLIYDSRCKDKDFFNIWILKLRIDIPALDWAEYSVFLFFLEHIMTLYTSTRSILLNYL